MLILDCPFYIIVVELSPGKAAVYRSAAVAGTEKRHTINIETK